MHNTCSEPTTSQPVRRSFMFTGSLSSSSSHPIMSNAPGISSSICIYNFSMISLKFKSGKSGRLTRPSEPISSISKIFSRPYQKLFCMILLLAYQLLKFFLASKRNFNYGTIQSIPSKSTHFGSHGFIHTVISAAPRHKATGWMNQVPLEIFSPTLQSMRMFLHLPRIKPSTVC